MAKRYATFCACASLLSYGLAMTVLGPAVEAIAASFGASPGDIGALTASMSAGFIAAVFMAGALAGRLRPKAVFMAGQAALAAGLALAALSPGLKAGLASYLLIGLGGGLVQISANTIIAGLYPGARVSALNFLHVFFGTGALSGPLISGIALSRGIPWQALYASLGIAAFIILLLVAAATLPPAGDGPGPPGEFFALLKNRLVLLVCGAVVLYVGIEMGINTWAVLYLKKTRGMGGVAASAVLSYFWFFITAGRVAMIWLSRAMRPGTILAFLSAGAAASFACFVAVSGPAISLSLTGFMFSGIFPALVGLGAAAAPENLGRITGLTMTSLGIGLMAFPWAAGAIGERLAPDAGMIFLLAAHAGLVACAVAIALTARRR